MNLFKIVDSDDSVQYVVAPTSEGFYTSLANEEFGKVKSVEFVSDSVHVELTTKEATAESYIFTAATALDITVKQLQSRNRHRHTVAKRSAIMWMIKQKFNLTVTELAKLFNRDHSTVVHALQKASNSDKDNNSNIPNYIGVLKQLESGSKDEN